MRLALGGVVAAGSVRLLLLAAYWSGLPFVRGAWAVTRVPEPARVGMAR